MNDQFNFAESIPDNPEIAARFSDLHPPLDLQAAIPEANRCLFCFDAPCATACPTHIDVPRFIRKISTGNMAGSAYTILDANILGGSCARACPVEVLCEGACVLHRYNKQPIQIGRLQRFAIETFSCKWLSTALLTGRRHGPLGRVDRRRTSLARLRCGTSPAGHRGDHLRCTPAARRIEYLRRCRV